MMSAIPLPLRERFNAFLGREPHPTGAARKVWNMSSPATPHLRFEWHPGKRNVYLVRLGQKPEIGEVMAFNIETHGDAINAVNIWLRGYAEGQAPSVPKLHLRD